MRMVMIAAMRIIAKALSSRIGLRLAIMTDRSAVLLAMQCLPEFTSCAIPHC
jgi:hypothetical protein